MGAEAPGEPVALRGDGGTKDQIHVPKRVRSDCRDQRTRIETLVTWARLHPDEG